MLYCVFKSYLCLVVGSQVRCTLPQQSTPEKSRTQIVIEEAELIRFLQTGEGAELIAKAYNISLNEFNNFITQAKQRNNLKGLLVSGGTV